jgi:hypothetical protein
MSGWMRLYWKIGRIDALIEWYAVVLDERVLSDICTLTRAMLRQDTVFLLSRSLLLPSECAVRQDSPVENGFRFICMCDTKGSCLRPSLVSGYSEWCVQEG